VDAGGRSLTRTSKGLQAQMRPRTGSSKGLQQQAEEIAADILMCQIMIRRVLLTPKVRWGIFGCAVDEGQADERSGFALRQRQLSRSAFASLWPGFLRALVLYVFRTNRTVTRHALITRTNA
jgi:hypothetical protein